MFYNESAGKFRRPINTLNQQMAQIYNEILFSLEQQSIKSPTHNA